MLTLPFIPVFCIWLLDGSIIGVECPFVCLRIRGFGGRKRLFLGHIDYNQSTRQILALPQRPISPLPNNDPTALQAHQQHSVNGCVNRNGLIACYERNLEHRKPEGHWGLFYRRF